MLPVLCQLFICVNVACVIFPALVDYQVWTLNTTPPIHGISHWTDAM